MNTEKKVDLSLQIRTAANNINLSGYPLYPVCEDIYNICIRLENIGQVNILTTT